MAFASLNVSFLALFLLISLTGFGSLSVLSYLYFFVAFVFWIRWMKRISLRPSLDFKIGAGLGLAFGILAYSWVNGLFVAPSQDDTLNHLGFLDAILNSGNALLGKINRPGADWFGESPYHFYPTGAHAIVALNLYPFLHLGFAWPKLFKAIQVLTLALFPVALWSGSLRAFPKIPRSIRIFLVVAAYTVIVFPVSAFGEGGFSRIFALTLFVPYWFRTFERPLTFREAFNFTAFLGPALLFIHPCLLPLMAVSVLFLDFAPLLGLFVAAPVGVFFFYSLMHSAVQEVTHPNFIHSLLAGLHDDAYGWFDRLKGPFHYWFGDPAGFGKFFSPKNYFVYLAIGLAIIGKLPRRLLIMFAIPFVTAAFALLHFSATDQIGLIFYHSVKRIAELTPLIGFTLACFSATWVFTRYQNRKVFNAIALVLSVAFFTLFIGKSQEEIQKENAMFQSPTDLKVASLKEPLSKLAVNDRILNDNHDYDVIRFIIPEVFYSVRPECMEVEPSRYCLEKKIFRNSLLKGTDADFDYSGKIWWLPTPEEAKAASEALQELPNIRLDEHGVLYQIFPRPNDQ